MSEIHYIERVPRHPDFCGCPPCPLCYEPVITDGQRMPVFEDLMKVIYQERPAPQTEQEYEWAHAAAHETRQELEAMRPDGTYFQEQDRAHLTQVQIDDLLKQARKTAAAPKPLNRVNLDDMPVEAIEAASKTKKKVPEKSPAQRFAEAQAQYQELQIQRQAQQQIYTSALNQVNQTVPLSAWLSPAEMAYSSRPGGSWKGP